MFQFDCVSVWKTFLVRINFIKKFSSIYITFLFYFILPNHTTNDFIYVYFIKILPKTIKNVQCRHQHKQHLWAIFLWVCWKMAGRYSDTNFLIFLFLVLSTKYTVLLFCYNHRTYISIPNYCGTLEFVPGQAGQTPQRPDEEGPLSYHVSVPNKTSTGIDITFTSLHNYSYDITKYILSSDWFINQALLLVAN